MKKYIIFTFLVNALFINAQEGFEVNKEVEGISTKVYDEGRELKEELSEIDFNDIDLKDLGIEAEIGFEKDILSVEDLSETFGTSYDFLKEEIGNKVSNILDSNRRDNYLYFGFAGFNEIDGLEYGLQYGDSYEDIDYRIKLDRDVKGEDRKNSNVSLDSLNVLVDYKKLKSEFDIKILDENYPGMVNSISQVESSRKLAEYSADFNYTLFEEKEDMANLNVDIYHAESDSVSLSTSEYTRQWKNTNVNLWAEYEKLVRDESANHLLEGRFGYLYDEMYTGESGTLYLEGRDRFKIESLKDFDFKAGLALESSTKENIEDEFNFSADFEASKKINDNLSIYGIVKKDNRTKSSKDIRDEFNYVNDIVAFNELKAEDKYQGTFGANYTYENLFVEAFTNFNSSTNKIYFEQVEVDTNRENAIIARNFGDTLNWFDFGFKGTYILENNLRSELNLLYTTLDKISYIPQLKANLATVYEIDKYETRLVINYNGDMYANLNKQNELDSFVTVDWFNVYNFSQNVNGSFGIENIFDQDKEVMSGYPIDGRRFSLRFNMKY